jgi:hypothetical protein
LALAADGSSIPAEGVEIQPVVESRHRLLSGNLEAARAALEAGEDANASPEGLPILHCAIVGSHVAVARLLIEHGADVHAGDKLRVGRTPLRTCVTSERNREGTVPIARMLLEHGADPTRGPWGSVIDVARRRKWHRMVQLLEEFAEETGGRLAEPGTELRVGDRVRIGSGTWAGQVGVIEQSVSADAPHSARIRFNIFGRDVLIDVPLGEIWSPGTSDKPSSPE